LLEGLRCQARPRDPYRQVAEGERLRVSVPVVLEGDPVQVELDAVEFDDDPLLDEQRVDDIAADLGSHEWDGQAMVGAESREVVLPTRPWRRAREPDQRSDPARRREVAEAADDLAEL